MSTARRGGRERPQEHPCEDAYRGAMNDEQWIREELEAERDAHDSTIVNSAAVGMVAAVTLGPVLGLFFGRMLDDLALGLVFGMPLGIAIGLGVGLYLSKRSERTRRMRKELRERQQAEAQRASLEDPDPR